MKILQWLFGPASAPTQDPLLGAAQIIRDTLGETKKTPLDIQRLVYLAQLHHLGKTGDPIFPDLFQATVLGPIVPRLMPLLKRKSGISHPIHQSAVSSNSRDLIETVTREYRDFTPGMLVAVTHGHLSAWAQYFNDASCRSTYTGRQIPLTAMTDEYRARADVRDAA
jgi:uncharacterized phage-associated protein